MQQSGEEGQGVCARGLREGNELWSEKQQKDIKHCLQQSAKTEIAIFLSLPVFFKLLHRETLSQHPKKPPVKRLYSHIEVTMKKKQMILYIFFFFECVRVYNIYIFIYIFIFLYVYNLTRAHTHMSMKKTHRLTKKQALEKGWQSLHIFFFPLQKMQGRAKE